MDWNNVLTILLTAVVIPAISIIGAAIFKYLQENIKDTRVRKYLLIATDCVIDAVADIAQTYVDKVADTDWTDEAKKEAFEMAKEKALKHLGITGRMLLEEALGDFDGWVNTKIEAEVKRLEVHNG